MRRKIVAIFGIFALVFVLAGCCCTTSANEGAMNFEGSKSPSEYNTGLTLEQAYQEGKPVVVKFYADWCGACQKAAPVFNEVRTEMAEQASFVMVNADSNSNLAEQFGIRHYPTLFIVNPSSGEKEEIPNEYVYDVNSLKTYLNSKLEAFKPAKKVYIY